MKGKGAMSKFGTVRLLGVEYALDDLTLDEVEEIEDLCGAAMGELDLGRARTLKNLAFVLMKRNDPDVTLEAVGKIKLVEFVDSAESDEDEPGERPLVAVASSDDEPPAVSELANAGSL